MVKGKTVKTVKIFIYRFLLSHGITARLYDSLDTVFPRRGFLSVIKIKKAKEQQQKKSKLKTQTPKKPPKLTPAHCALPPPPPVNLNLQKCFPTQADFCFHESISQVKFTVSLANTYG